MRSRCLGLIMTFLGSHVGNTGLHIASHTSGVYCLIAGDESASFGTSRDQ